MAASKVEFKTTDLTEFGWQPSGESWRYRVLSEEALQAELARLSNPESNSAARTDSVTIQPCQLESEKSQDRLAVQVWDLPGGTWTFAMVLDGKLDNITQCTHTLILPKNRLLGHAGDETAELAVKTLPSDLQDRLGKALASRSSDITSIVPAVIQETLTSFDESLVSDLKSIFPGGIDEIQKLSDAEIKAVINDSDRGGVNNAVVLRCMRGSTALISLIDPHHNVYVASLGDCQAGKICRIISGI
jgi:pyruvate dehydrogenase phosphatase